MPITRNVALTNSVSSTNSRYVQGGLSDTFDNRVGFWDRYTIPTATDDITIKITNRTQHRPDLVAYDVYGQSNLQWLVLQFNNVVDIIDEFTVGATITLPSPTRLGTSIMTQSTGGKQIT